MKRWWGSRSTAARTNASPPETGPRQPRSDLARRPLCVGIGSLKGILPPLPPLASGPPAPAAAARSRRGRRPQYAAAACRSGTQQGLARLSVVWTGGAGGVRLRTQEFPGARASGRPVGKAEGADFKRHFTGAKGRNTPPRRARRLWAHADVGLGERGDLLATTGRRNGRWDRR